MSMKKALGMVLATAFVSPAFADVGVSITVGQPGFFGQIDIGRVPQPQVVYPQPVVVQPAPEYVRAEPIYLHVPPGHEKHWSKHCAEYHACGRPVYFVRDDWYNNEYVRHYGDSDRDRHREHEEHEHRRDHDDHDRRDDRHHEDHDHDR
jgi:hypothetical protein